MRGKPSSMCQHCYDWQKDWNARKHQSTMQKRQVAVDGMMFCTACRTPKPVGEFGTNPFQRRKIAAGESTAKTCVDCRSLRAAKLLALRHDKHQNPEKKATYLIGRRDYGRQFRLKLIEAYGGHCVCCGETEPKFLELDHIDGGGGDHRREIGAGAEALYRWCVRNGFPATLQILCANCHNAKSFWGTCPHQDFSVLHLVTRA